MLLEQANRQAVAAVAATLFLGVEFCLPFIAWGIYKTLLPLKERHFNELRAAIAEAVALSESSE